MKYFVYILPLIMLLSSCEDDIFDREPLDKISDNDVWQSGSMMESYITQLYTQYPYFSFRQSQFHNWSDESSVPDGNENSVTSGGASRTNDNIAYWEFGYIRDLNVFLEKVSEAPISDAQKRRMEGEVRTMRAAAYFEKQKRYGGVPLVNEVIDPFSPVGEQFTQRSTEEAIADFIDAELSKAIELLPDDPNPKGRINKWTAYALKARANLWSGSIAKYGTVQLNGLAGIPEARANDFFAKASAAANGVISSNEYSLFRKYADKSENYRKLFLLEDEANSEVIFERVFDGDRLGHEWDAYMAAPPFSSGLGSNQNPVLEFILGYENIDGSPDQPEFGPDHLYENGFEPFQNKDPRLKATVFFQGDPFVGSTYELYEGLDPSPSPNPNAIISNLNQSYQGIPTAGNSSRLVPRRGTSTGFVVKKYVVEENMVPRGQSQTNWIVLRLAEMYLTVAEAEFELGNTQAAATALNETRERAGISLVDANTITLNHIRTERKSELAYEVHRYWDLRRWRIAEPVLNHQFQGLRPILHYETGKYYFLPMNAESSSRIFRPEHYYNPMTNNRINNNPDLVENPLY